MAKEDAIVFIDGTVVHIDVPSSVNVLQWYPMLIDMLWEQGYAQGIHYAFRSGGIHEIRPNWCS